MSFMFYKLTHIAGITLLFLGLGASILMHAAKLSPPMKIKMLAFASHGVGLVLLLVSGFGMLARLGVSHGNFPQWIYYKLLIWVTFGVFLTVIRKKSELPVLWLLSSVLLAVTAAYIGLNKP